MKQTNTPNSDKAKLAAGAAEIRKLQEQAKGKAKKPEVPKPGPVGIPESTRPIEDILKDRVTVLPGSIGLKLADNTLIEESLCVLDWATTLSDHVGFMIGDVLNFGHAKWGDKYTEAINRTGRARSTLKHYASVAARIPLDKRQPSLSFSHHELIVRTSAPLELLEETAKQAEQGDLPTILELRTKVRKLTPTKPKRVTSGKAKKGPPKPQSEGRKLSEKERQEIDELLGGIDIFSIRIKNAKKLLLMLPNREKKKWLPVLESFVDQLTALRTDMEKTTGYGDN
jgi:hypothetical protein